MKRYKGTLRIVGQHGDTYWTDEWVRAEDAEAENKRLQVELAECRERLGQLQGEIGVYRWAEKRVIGLIRKRDIDALQRLVNQFDIESCYDPTATNKWRII